MITEKRFTICHEQNDINGWTMSIVDWQTKEPFNYTTYEVHSSSITDTKDEMEDLCLLLNELNDENKELKQELKDYHNAFDCSQCKYQNYDWFDDGDEFEVCDKGNNEAQMDNHSCKEWEEL